MKRFYEAYWRGEHIVRNAFDVNPSTGITEEWYQKRLELFGGRLRGRVLDYGCGNGKVTERMRRDGYDVTGCDVSEEALAMARRKCGGVGVFDLIDGEVLPYRNATFDTVVAMDVLEHILDVEGVLREIRRVLKPGGYLLAETTEMTRCKLAVVVLWRFHEYFAPSSPHIRHFTARNLVGLLEDVGFEVVKRCANYRHLGLMPMGQFVAARAR